MATFQEYEGWRNRLMNLLERVVDVTETLSLPKMTEVYTKLLDQLKSDTLKIQVVGVVKNGKSSFTNSMIGEKILPVDDIPCTAVVSEVKYGEKKKAVVHFCSPLPTDLLDEIPAETRAYIEKHNRGKDQNGKDVGIPPLEIPYDQLNKYVCIPIPPDEVLYDPEALKEYRAKIDLGSPFDFAELFYPAPFLKNGVEIVDTPGLDESPKRTAVTLEYLKKADAAIYLTDSTKPFMESESKFISEKLQPLGFTNFIMVANRFDMVENKERMRRFLTATALQYTSIKQLFTVSAKEALIAFQTGDNDRLQKSGIPEFMDFLIDYLTSTKGALKINKPGEFIISSVQHDLLNIIQNRRASLDTQSHELQARLNEAIPIYNGLLAKRERVANQLDHDIASAMHPISKAITSKLEDVESQLNDWVMNYTPTTEIGIVPTNKKVKVLAGEIVEFLGKKMEEDISHWNNDTFQTVMLRESEAIFGRLTDDMKSIATELNKIDDIMSNVNTEGGTGVNAFERIAGIAAMLFLPLGHAGSDLLVGGFDLNNFLKNLAVDTGLGLTVGILALYVWHPIGWIAIIGGILWGLVSGGIRVVEKTKKLIIETATKELHEKAPIIASETVAKVRKTFDDLKDSVLKGIDTEIATTKHNLDEIRRMTTEGEASIAAERKKLDELQTALSGVVSDASKLIDEIK